MEPRVVRADNPSPMTLDGTRTYLVGRDRPVVIDPGPADPRHLARLRERLGGARPVAILLTHAHPDHAAGAPALARATGAPLWLAPGALDADRWHGEVEHWARGGDRLQTDEGVLSAVPTPGHAQEHTAYLWSGGAAPPRGALFVGDLFMGEGDTTLVAPPEGDLAAYLRSLDVVEELDAGVLYPAHGPPLPDPAEAVRRFRRHRLERIRQVAGLRRELPGATPAELVEAVYGSGLHPGLRRAAEGSLSAVLEYLRRERMH
jgi:glyoxylase-like metal-dependent hydrolase (beta-lactamase superfamily II)